MPDVNGTRHHLLLGRDDWARAIEEPREKWDYQDAQEGVTLAPQAFVFPQPGGDAPLVPGQRRGAARDPFGHWFWIGPDELEIRVRWSDAPTAEHYWSSTDVTTQSTTTGSVFAPAAPPAAANPEALSGLAVTANHLLVAGSSETGEMLVFDLHTGGSGPRRISLPAPANTPAMAPPARFQFDMAPTSDGGLLVLDCRRLLAWRLDANLEAAIIGAVSGSPPLFQPDGDGADSLESLADMREVLVMSGIESASAVESLPDRTFLVLERHPGSVSTVHRFGSQSGAPVASIELSAANLRDQSGPDTQMPGIQAHDFAFVPGSDAEPVSGTLYFIDRGGNQAFAVTLTTTGGLRLRAQADYYPLRGHTGRALVTPPGADAPYFDQGERWQPVVALGRPQFATSATLTFAPMDGREPDCTWHRLALDACIPPDTAVRVQTRAANHLDDIEREAWTEEPPLYRRGYGSELAQNSLWNADELRNSSVGTWELLFQQAQGRFLQARLLVSGNRRETPVLRALRVHYPRFSYLRRYLPRVYQDDPVSASFLDRFLANPEGLLTVLEGQIAQAQVGWDVRTTDAIDWLGGWIGIVMDDAWNDYQRRLLVAHAYRFFQRRGTMTGLAWLIRIAIEACAGPELFDADYDDRTSTVRIVERFRTRTAPGVVFGDPTDSLAQGNDVLAIARERAHSFTVLLPHGVTDDQVSLVERIVESEKPAHTWVQVKRFWDMFRVGEARLGYDTRLAERTPLPPIRLGSTGLSEGVLAASYPYTLTDHIVLAR